METTSIRRRAARFEQDNDGLGLLGLTRECCDEIDRMHRLMAEVGDAFWNWGPTDDGTPEGLALEEALKRLWFALPKKLRKRKM
jgi:hypothetical protein